MDLAFLHRFLHLDPRGVQRLFRHPYLDALLFDLLLRKALHILVFPDAAYIDHRLTQPPAFLRNGIALIDQRLQLLFFLRKRTPPRRKVIAFLLFHFFFQLQDVLHAVVEFCHNPSSGLRPPVLPSR